jgi:hypothetical protein
MSQNPLNLTLRFILEICALVAIGYGGWHAAEGFWRYLLAIGLPLIAATLWGMFRTPNEPHAPQHSTRAVSGWVRLLIEALVFGGGAWGLFSSGATTLGWVYSTVVILHYAASYDRVVWLLRD